MFNPFKSSSLAPGQKEYKSVIVFDTKGTVSGIFGDPVGNEISKWGKKGWILESDELVTKGNMFSASRRRLTFSKGSAPVADISKGSESSADEIAKLAKLRDDGILTEEEFQSKKKQVLGL